ncbi:ATP-binding protein [Sphingobacterium sp.]|uniref:AlbA family DNA-binding domain-containing protein n=1 Tax=Sphingobacterium sp. TaxID=341027 RepID=UPI0028A0D4AF|nr:ATP-binding protein [Sphingobacterium sp.]
MKETVFNLIENESENTKLDFKSQQYPIDKGNIRKSEFLKDMSAFANLPNKEDKYIIVGIEEKNGIAVGFKSIEKLHDQALYQQFLNQYIEPEINFEYREILYQGHRLAYFRLFNNNNKPYLFKKEYNDNHPKGSHYRIGTGFVRTGTSTRELRRDDFEKIYSERCAKKDRSEDIDFELALGAFESEELRYLGYIKHLQIDINNRSNTSIDLDVEAKVYNIKNKVEACCTQWVEEKLYRNKRDKSMFAYTTYLDKIIPPYSFIDMNVEFENCKAYSKYEITAKKGALTAVRVKQKGALANIFNGQIALIFSQTAELKIELIVRSDDFADGLKIFTYYFSKDDIDEIIDPYDL